MEKKNTLERLIVKTIIENSHTNILQDLGNQRECVNSNNIHTKHQDIQLTTNKYTGRKSKINGFLQHAYSVWDEDQQKMLEFKDLIKNPITKPIWNTSYANELGRLSQGIWNIKGTNCVHFIPHTKVPNGRKVTYRKLVLDYKTN